MFIVHVACHADLINFMIMIIFGEECKFDEAIKET
jgi:hypothetical protein